MEGATIRPQIPDITPPAAGGRDNRNTAEQIIITNPVCISVWNKYIKKHFLSLQNILGGEFS